MAADGSDSASFTVRLINQVTAPARQVQSAVSGMTKSIQAAQRAMSAPAPRRGALSEWDKMVSGAKRSQASDFARAQAAAAKAQQAAAKRSQDVSKRIAQDHADHGLKAMIAEGGSDLALGATAAIAAGAVAAAVAVGYLGVKFGEASIEGAMFAQKSQMAIGYLTDSAAQGSKQFEEVRNMAQGLGLSVDETVHSFQRLLAAQFSIGQSKSLIKMAADMQSIGASGEEIQRILYALDEVKSIGTLQKRQERMLMMAGISGQLIEHALMKRTGLKSVEEVAEARKKNKIGADIAIEAIKDAVMHKVHENKLGEAGAAFAATTLTGMTNQFHSGIENFFIDVGQLITPGLTKLAGHFRELVLTLVEDPAIANLGQFLLNTFDDFVLWVDGNWPQIRNTFVTGAEAMAASLRFVVEMFDMSTIQGQVTIGVLGTLAAVLAIVAVAGFVLMLPLYALIAVIGLLAYAIVSAIDWIIGKIREVAAYIPGMGSKDTAIGAASALPQVGLGQWGAIPSLASNDNGIQPQNAASGLAALSAMQGDKTVAGEGTGIQPVNVTQHITVPQADDPQKQASLIGQEVHSQIAKILRQAS